MDKEIKAPLHCESCGIVCEIHAQKHCHECGETTTDKWDNFCKREDYIISDEEE